MVENVSHKKATELYETEKKYPMSKYSSDVLSFQMLFRTYIRSIRRKFSVS